MGVKEPAEVAIDAGTARPASTSTSGTPSSVVGGRSASHATSRRARRDPETSSSLARRPVSRVRPEDGAAVVRQNRARSTPGSRSRASRGSLPARPTRAEVNDTAPGQRRRISANGRRASRPRSISRVSKSFVTFIKIFLLGFAGIALFVGAFIIFNTFAITVAQRTREFATAADDWRVAPPGSSARSCSRLSSSASRPRSSAPRARRKLIAKFLNAVMKADGDRPTAGGAGLLAAHGSRQLCWSAWL